VRKLCLRRKTKFSEAQNAFHPGGCNWDVRLAAGMVGWNNVTTGAAPLLHLRHYGHVRALCRNVRGKERRCKRKRGSKGG
jgi:hypothetical protein